MRETGTIGEFLNGWTKKHRTMLRFIRAGDVFCFTRNDGTYFFGQIISKILCGHSAQIFDVQHDQPTLDAGQLVRASRLMQPIVLDSYSLFDRKSDVDSDWRIVGRHEVIDAQNAEQHFFVYGAPGSWTKVNAGNSIECPASEMEAKSLSPLTPLNNFKVWLAIDAIQRTGS